MPIRHGSNTPSKFMVGTSAASKVYLGTTLLWTAVTVAISNQFIWAEDSASPYIAYATYTLSNTGTVLYDTTPSNGNGGATSGTLETWLLSGAASDYECRATLTSGSLTTGTTGTWMSLSTSRQWQRDRAAFGSASATLTIEIRRASDGVVLDSATITLQADAGI